LQNIVLGLDKAPRGISVEGPTPTQDGFALQLKAAGDSGETRFVGNLIVRAYKEFYPKKGGKPDKSKGKRRWPMSVLPAIPVEVTPPAPAKLAGPS
jgi:hypothetical protein